MNSDSCTMWTVSVASFIIKLLRICPAASIHLSSRYVIDNADGREGFTVNNHPIQRAEPEDKVVFVNLEFHTNKHCELCYTFQPNWIVFTANEVYC